MHFDADIALARLAIAQGDFEGARTSLDQLGEDAEQRADYWEILAFIQLREGEPGKAAASLRTGIERIEKAFGRQRFMMLGTLAEALLSDGQLEEARKVSERLYRDARQHPLPNYLMSRVEYQSGNPQQALAYAQSLLSIQPNSALGNTLAGAASLAMDQPAQAENYLSRAVSSDPDNVTARKLLAQTRLGLGSPQDALSALQPVTGLDAEAAAMAGMASIRAGDPEAAIELFRGQLAQDPDNDTLRMQLVVSLMAAGRNDEALAELGLVQDLDDAGQLRADLIEVAVHLQSDDLVEARAAASAAAQAREGDAQVRNSLGALFLAGDQFDDATAWFEDALSAEPGNAAAHFNLGRIAASNGRVEEAEAHFNAVLENDPDNAAAQTALAQLSWSTGRRAEAIRRLEALRESAAQALPAQLLLARYLQAEGESDRALSVAREAASRHPQNADAVNTLGRMQLDAGQAVEALKSFEQAVELAPGNPQLLLNRARAHLAQGDAERARADLRNALALDPDFNAARFPLADLERRTGRLDAAAEALRRLAIDPGADNPAVALLQGELLLARGNPEAAIPAFQTARDGGIGSRAVVGLFQARLQAGQPDAAQVLEEAIAADPDAAPVRVLAADHYLRTGAYDKAIGHYEALVQRQPDNAALLNNLAWLYAEVEDPRALDTAERALASAPESPMVMDTLGWILHRQGNNERAFELISKAAAQAPGVPEIRYHHAVLLAETGDEEGAVSEARALLADETAVQYHSEAQALLERLGR